MIMTSQPELPSQAAMNDLARCCANFSVRDKAGADEFILSGGVRNRDGGTAEYAIEDIYHFDPATGRVSLA